MNAKAVRESKQTETRSGADRRGLAVGRCTLPVANRIGQAHERSYLGGLVLDCLLKACLLEKHPGLNGAAFADLPPDGQRRWNLVFRSHDLEGLLVELPDLVRRLHDSSAISGDRLDTMLKRACSRWSIHVRYLPKRLDASDADEFLEQVEELKRWL